MNRRHKGMAAFLLILALSASLAFASNGTQIGTVGARSTAMGSAFRGLADDWSAVYFNPAGLTQFQGKWSFGFSGGLIAPRGSYEAYQYPNIPFTGLITTEVDATDRNFFVPAMGVFYRANEKLTVGLGVYAPFGLGTEWNLVELPAGYGNTLKYENENYSDHQVINIQPTIAYKLSDRISLGLGLSYMWGKMDLRMVKTVANPLLSPYPLNTAITTYQALQLGIGAALTDLTPDQMRLAAENVLSGTGSAFGFNIGVLAQLTDKLSMGLSARYSTDLALSGTNTLYTHLLGDATKYAVLTAAAQAQAAAVFSGQTLTEKSDVDADLPLPISAGIGFAYKPSNKLTLTLDATWSNWASWDVITVEVDGGDNLALEQDWKNTIEVNAGFEFKATENLFIRGGYYTVDTPAPAETMSPTLLDPNRRHVITGGFGLNTGRVTFNLAGEYVMFAENTVDDYVFDASQTAENYAGVYNFKAFVVTLGAQINLN